MLIHGQASSLFVEHDASRPMFVVRPCPLSGAAIALVLNACMPGFAMGTESRRSARHLPPLASGATAGCSSGWSQACLRLGSIVHAGRLLWVTWRASRWLACLALTLVLMGWPARSAIALESLPVSLPVSASYRCDGDLLLVQYEAGAVDDPAIPNSLAGTLPGAFVLIDWRHQHLQLPRTNNSSAAPSYSDGRWWWRPLSVEQPEFRQRRGSLMSYACEPAIPAPEAPQVIGATSGPGV